MGFSKPETGLVLLAIAAELCAGAMAQSGCTSMLQSLAPCLNYITGNSSTPSSTCCSQLDAVVQSSPQCLCSAMNGAGIPSVGININRTQAMQLPGACNVKTLPVSQCNGANGATAPANSPLGSPLGSPADDTPGAAITPSAADDPSGAGSKTVPSTDDGSSNANIARATSSLIFFSAFAASSALVLIRF